MGMGIWVLILSKEWGREWQWQWEWIFCGGFGADGFVNVWTLGWGWELGLSFGVMVGWSWG